MRSIHWLFVVSVLLFVSGIGFVIAGGLAARAASVEVPSAAPAVTPIASVKQIMNGIVGPSALTVFQAVSVTMTTTGTEEKMPRTDEEWEMVGAAAAALIESGNLLLMGGRAVDSGDWVKMSHALMESAKVTLEATTARDVDRVLVSGEAINASCDNCHTKYQRGS